MQRSFSRSRQAHQSLWQRFDEQPGLTGSALSLFLESLAPEVLELLAQATSSVIKMLTALPVKGILPKLNNSIRIVGGFREPAFRCLPETDEDRRRSSLLTGDHVS